MVDPQNLNNISLHSIGHDEGPLGDDELTCARDDPSADCKEVTVRCVQNVKDDLSLCNVGSKRVQVFDCFGRP